ncbi:ImmA/IrrE family metallo-endopeptidase, partial [bacterium]|nr:ImmA/IrrE family metallo-endopeptidase [bacterium]
MNLPKALEPLENELAFKSIWDIYAYIDSLGIELVEANLPPGEKGFFYQDAEHKVIFISEKMLIAEKRVTAVHELVHAILHEDTGAFLLANKINWSRFEYEARVYTARLLIPKNELIKMLEMEYSIYEIAEEFQVTEE